LTPLFESFLGNLIGCSHILLVRHWSVSINLPGGWVDYIAYFTRRCSNLLATDKVLQLLS
jgi:hypothetical protein